MEKIPHPGQKKSKADLMDEWNKKLASEGMPEELEAQHTVEHTPAYDAAVRNMITHFLNGEAHYGAHRSKTMEVLEDMKAGGATDVEINEVQDGMDDFARQIEDMATQLQNEAMSVGHMIIEKSPRLKGHPDKLAKQIAAKLGDIPNVSEENIMLAATMVADKIFAQ